MRRQLITDMELSFPRLTCADFKVKWHGRQACHQKKKARGEKFPGDNGFVKGRTSRRESKLAVLEACGVGTSEWIGSTTETIRGCGICHMWDAVQWTLCRGMLWIPLILQSMAAVDSRWDSVCNMQDFRMKKRRKEKEKLRDFRPCDLLVMD